MNRFADHLLIAPIVLPAVCASAVMLVLGGERRRSVNAAINVLTTFALVAISIALLRAADGAPTGLAGVYRLGNWRRPVCYCAGRGPVGGPDAIADKSSRHSRSCVRARSLAPCGRAFPSSVSVPADGNQ